MSIKNILAIIVSLAVISCTDKEAMNEHSGADSVILPRVSSYNYSSGNDETAETNEIGILHACLFENGVMTRVYADIDPLAGIKIDDSKGRLYMVANIEGNNSYNIGMSEEEWLSTTVTHTGGVNLRYMSGVIDLADMSHGVLQLYRGVARIDVKVSEEHNLSVPAIMFKNIAQQSYLNRRNTVESPESTGYNDVTPVIDTPLTGSTYGVAYLCEQASENISAVLTINVDGETVEKEVALPSILKRNCVYTINVFKESVQADVTLSVTDWENGGDFNLTPNERGLMVDIEGTSLPAYAEVDADRRGIVLSHYASDFVLSVDCDDELEFVADPELPMTVERIGGTENVGKNLFRLIKKIWYPGMERVERKLMFHRKGLNENYPDDYVNVVMSENPVKLEGLIHFEDSASFDFGKYIDNELGVFTVPASKSITVEYDEGEDEWVKLDASGQRVRVIGGWRPNDRTANGRVQKARIVISNSADGSEREEYVISRRNWGLPVTKLNGVWWCKYNAIGDAKNFSEQILSSADPAVMAGKTVFDYLRDCTADEFFNLWKWNYQGKSSQGLQVIDDGGVAKLEGYSSSAEHINKIDAKALAPDGYELPSMENFERVFNSTSGTIWLMWDGSHTTAWNGSTTIQRRQRRRNDVTVGTVSLTDLIYISMYNQSETEYEPLVWYGSSPQWNNDGINHGHYNNLLIAVHNPSDGQGWFFVGGMGGLYPSKNSAGPNDTRILRFKKSDVEYIY
ncbi:hypothetical protein QVN91_08630 [Bacteroides caecigallinarum]|nr:hypothetical protein [Bacteroides caecigallinarum]